MNKKLYNELHLLGEAFMKTGVLNETLIHADYKLSKSKACFYELMHKISLGDSHWNQQLKKIRFMISAMSNHINRKI